MSKKWNPRYLNYCRLNGGLSPKKTLKRDSKLYPGGKMGGFTVWMSEQWREWTQENYGCDYLYVKDEKDFKNFDLWLTNKKE